MARIHSVNLYPMPNHSGKGDMLKLTSALPAGMGFGGQAPAFSQAQQAAERRELKRVMSGAPGHLAPQGIPPRPRREGPVSGRPVMLPNTNTLQAVRERIREQAERFQRGPVR